MRGLLQVTAVAALLAAGACSSSDCTDNRNSLPLAGFYSSQDPTQAVSLDTLYIGAPGAPNDSVLTVRGASEAYLPFDLEKSRTTFVFRYNRVPEALFDTISFNYRTKPWFESQECGVIYLYEIENISTTTHFIDSVSCPKGVIDNKPGQNLRIYLRISDTENLQPK